MTYRTVPSLSRRRWMALMGAATIAGCGRRGVIAQIDPGPPEGADVMKAIVATSRRPADAPVFFSDERDFATNFARFAISVPPDRKLGDVRYPRGKPDPRRDFLVLEAERLAGPQGFVGAVNAAAAAFPASGRTGVLYVHGFNTNFAEALIKDAQLRHDIQSPGVGVLFTWPTEAKLLAYVADRENALFSRDALAETMSLMRRTTLRGYNLVAHSMGTFLAMETLRTLALSGERSVLDRVNALILISADLDVDVFRRQAPPVLAAGVPIYLLVSDDDRALKLSAVIRGERARLGNVRSTAEIGGLDVSILDLSAVNAGDPTGHLKVGTSPELIALIRSIRQSGVAIFEDGQKVGVLDAGSVLVQGATGLVLRPIGG
ncbi:MAG: alpha/beta hydrolase [Gemmobacter sp.]